MAIARALIDLTDDRAEVSDLPEEFARRDIEVEWASPRLIQRERVAVDRNTVVVGTLLFVTAALRRLSIDLPQPADYPAALEPYLHRRVWRSTVGEVRSALERCGPLFVKPAESFKRFTGAVFEFGDEPTLCALPDRLPVWCAEPVGFVSEWRIFVANGVEVGRRQYAGSSDGPPLDESVIRGCINAVSDVLAGSAFDVGVLVDGRTALVEVNEGFSVGRYGLAAPAYLDMVLARWAQLVIS